MSLPLKNADRFACFPELDEMLADMRRAPVVHQPSPHWQGLGAEQAHQLHKWGFENFKRTIGIRYFSWRLPGILAHQFAPVVAHWMRHPDRSVFHADFPQFDRPCGEGIHSMSAVEAWLYKVYVAMLGNLVASQDPWRLFQLVEEPTQGNPFAVRRHDRWISQDLCNSIHEFYCGWDCDAWGSRPAAVAEIGAGYGRLGHVFLTALPQASYCIIDLPPALFLAQEYLSRLFPQETIFRYRPFSSFAEVRDEFEASRIRFLMAHQIELLPDKFIDLMINISSLHEMTREQICGYYQQIDRLCRGRFYTKQWIRSRARENEFVIRQDEYPVPAAWTLLRQRRHPIQRWFYDELYEIGTPF
jgi:putative sugar O-methyltransferase